MDRGNFLFSVACQTDETVVIFGRATDIKVPDTTFDPIIIDELAQYYFCAKFCSSIIYPIDLKRDVTV